MRGRIQKGLGLIATALVLPAFVVLLGFWEEQRGTVDRAAMDADRQRLATAIEQLEARSPKDGRIDYRMQFQDRGQTYAGPLALQQARSAHNQAVTLVTIMDLRRWLPPVVVAAAGGMIVVSLALLLTGTLLGWAGRRSREALVRGFAAVRWVLPGALATLIGLGTIVFVAVVLFEALALAKPGLGEGDIKLLVAAAIAVLGGLFVAVYTLNSLRRAMAAFEPEPLPILARILTRAEAPGLWRLVDWLAERLGALSPDAIVVGLTDGFFVSAGPKLLRPRGEALSGRTLHVPLPLLPMLRVDELAAIIGHELAHFTGRDTDYSQRFLPIYVGIGRSLDALAAGHGARDPSLSAFNPALGLGMFVMDRFHFAVRRWSRVREFAADAAGAGPVTPDAAARALLRVGTVQPRVDEVLRAAYEDPDRAPDDLVAAIYGHVCRTGLGDPRASLEARQTHPTDTHPTTHERITALGLGLSDDLIAVARHPPPADALSNLSAYFADPAAVCAAASADFRTIADQRRDAEKAYLVAAAAEVDDGDFVVSHNTHAAGAAGLVGTFAFAAIGAVLLFLDLPGLPKDVARIAAITAIAIAAVFGLVGFWRLRRPQPPFLILRPDCLTVVGLDKSIAWSDLADLDLRSWNGRVTIRLLVRSSAALPARLPRARRVKRNAVGRVITATAVLPRKMTPHYLATLLGRYRRADQARRTLEASGSDAPRQAETETTREGQISAVAPGALPPLRFAAWRQTGLVVLWSLMLGAFLVIETTTFAPSLFGDWMVRTAARPVSDGTVADGECHAKYVFQVCHATLGVDTPSGSSRRRTSTLSLGVSPGETQVRLMADPVHPEWVTTDRDLDALPNRVATFATVTAALLAGTLVPLVALVRNRRRIASR